MNLDDETKQKCIDYYFDLVMHQSNPKKYSNPIIENYNTNYIKLAIFCVQEEINTHSNPYLSPQDIKKIISFYTKTEEYEKCKKLLDANKIIRDKYADWIVDKSFDYNEI